MRFNSHVDRAVDATVRLVNALSPGLDGGRRHEAPWGADLRRAVVEVVRYDGYEPRPSVAELEALRAEVLAARQVFEALDAGDDDTAAGLVNAMLRRTQAHPELDRDDDGGWSIHFHGPDTTFARGWSAGLAAGLAMAIGGDLGSRLGVCAAPECDRVWVDRSRNTHRRFCSLRCQNRVKAAAHRLRTRGHRAR
ncbi:CGNR zinc finger domain-containing protein [Phycicoccus duodecadis]|uniref:Putative stress-induced transcription regulator n=1 Tax=Phycicoccus duodecadis TaxID=173053 RepID=A0A2N3YH40_9MICO|nr:CGNR zinc finger domain-containing protein [Phycicoccus duodecadis]PKW26141.1 putative stress-induced transcription regulator [Phycicoccus duodecadis]